MGGCQTIVIFPGLNVWRAYYGAYCVRALGPPSFLANMDILSEHLGNDFRFKRSWRQRN